MIKSLLSISKPSRYIGNELNAVKKDLKDSMIRFALAFPDIYDVGMSHLGLKILYHILNSRDDVWAERVFAPWIDMEEKMRKENVEIFSLESASPLKDFDFVGFSLQYEMSYTNVLNMLDLAKIPLLSNDRDESYPLIIAGGPCAFNPEPMAEFIDFFVIGDGEEVINEIIDCYKSNKNDNKIAILQKMADIEGVYVPSLFSVKENSDGMLIVDSGKKMKKRIIKDLNDSPYPIDYIVPFTRPIHDRVVIEIMRGCSRGCRFCQAGMIYRPVRERNSSTVEDLAEKVIERTGYEELSLSSLSSCDHSTINDIVSDLIESIVKKKHVSISLPSLRTDAFSLELAQKIETAGKTGLTFAPEVASDKLRYAINKDISREQLLSTVRDAFKSGWLTIKLYFMIGLPTETDEDVLEIPKLIREVLAVAKSENRRANLSISISTFVPKAHTPFQWERQASIDEVLHKQRIITNKIGKNNRVEISFHSPYISYLEGVFARGDRKLAQVLIEAHKLGCKLDGWAEFFNYDKWLKAFDKCGIKPDVYHQEREIEQSLPWDHIDSGVTREFLISERGKAYKAIMTEDCRSGKCSRCGICNKKLGIEMRLDKSQKSIDKRKAEITLTKKEPISKIRFQFTKGEEVKFISHLDLVNVFTRAFRRANIPIAYSQGFSPHPKINFSSALPVGTTSLAEFADIEIEEDIDVQKFMCDVNFFLPSGVNIIKAKKIPLRSSSLMSQINYGSYIVRIPKDEYNINIDLREKIESINFSEHIIIKRKQKNKQSTKQDQEKVSQIDVKPFIKSIRLAENNNNTFQIEMIIKESIAGKVRPEEITSLLLGECADGDKRFNKYSSLDIQKIDLFVENQGRFFSPMDVF
ncbi:MAG: TIGR03960 family B12-binding radical SAM protein [Candidatus Poribacteria bacterium]